MPKPIDEFASEQITDAEVARLRERVESWRRRADAHKNEVARTQRELKAARQINDALLAIEDHVSDPPSWTAPKRRRGAHTGTPVLFLSDCHFDEVVDPDQVEGSNAYDRAIAERRLQVTAESTIKITRDFMSGLDFPGLVMFLGGDMFSGLIHEELVQTNDAEIMDSVLYWADRLEAVIGMMADEYGKVHLWCVVGNHGRNTRKWQAKNAAATSFDWLLYKLLAKAFAKDDRVTFTIPTSTDTTATIHNTRFNLTHGNQFNGGSGIAGILSPLSLGQHRKSRRNMALGNPFDWLTMGHFHQYLMGRGLIVNGSLKGYDEYAYQHNFDPEPATQGLWIVTPEHGITFSTPVFSTDRKAEGW